MKNKCTANIMAILSSLSKLKEKTRSHLISYKGKLNRNLHKNVNQMATVKFRKTKII